MLRKFPFLIAFALAGALVASGCSKKAPQTAAASEGSQATSSTPSGASESDLASKGAAESGAGDLSGLPVVHFGFNEYTLTSEDRDNLKAASDTLKKATSKITVEGHCDERGSSE